MIDVIEPPEPLESLAQLADELTESERETLRLLVAAAARRESQFAAEMAEMAHWIPPSRAVVWYGTNPPEQDEPDDTEPAGCGPTIADLIRGNDANSIQRHPDDPSEAEIERACREIRAEWTDKERIRRGEGRGTESLLYMSRFAAKGRGSGRRKRPALQAG